MKAIRRYLRISPKKVNLVADLVRGKNAEYALNFLQFTPKKSAKPLMEALRSAMANAVQNFKQKKENLYISKIVVNEGPTLKRARPVSRGRSHPILKRTTHIILELMVRPTLEKKDKTPKVKKVSTEKPSKEVTVTK